MENCDVLVQVGLRTSREGSSLYDDPIWWRGGFGIHGRPWIGATWAINPGLKEWFKDYRDQVTAAKQRRRDELHQGPKTERTRVPGYTGPREPALEKRVA